MDMSTRKKNIFTFGWYAIVTLEFELARRNVEFVNTEQLWFVTFTFTLSRTRTSRGGGNLFCSGSSVRDRGHGRKVSHTCLFDTIHGHTSIPRSSDTKKNFFPWLRRKTKTVFFRVKELSYVKFVCCNDRNSGQGTLFTFGHERELSTGEKKRFPPVDWHAFETG
jgi:hypothetical protein